MEYKYLLELLKSGLYEQSATSGPGAVRQAEAPEKRVLPGLLRQPGPLCMGPGLVARLSGSTAEFLHIWQLLFFGPAPFRWDGASLRLVFDSFVPGYLMPGDGVIEATFLGSVRVIYHASGLTELVPGKTRPVRWELTDIDEEKRIVERPALCGKDACAVRAGQITEINITME